MSVTIAAPWPTPRITITLPSPKFSDSKASEQAVSVKRSTDGTKTYTYVKSSNRKTLKLPFVLSRMKAIELERFVKSYISAPLFVTLQDGTAWAGTLTGDPFGQRAIGRAGGWPGNEAVEVTLEISAELMIQVEPT